MSLLHDILVLIVFAGPVAIVAYSIRGKLGLTKPRDYGDRPTARDSWIAPPVWAILVWVVALVAMIFLPCPAG